MRIAKCPVVMDDGAQCGATLMSRATVLEIAPSDWWEISDGGTIDDWEDSYAPEEQESGEGQAFYCEREHTALQIVAAAVGV